jgi:hypothetical protein
LADICPSDLAYFTPEAWNERPELNPFRRRLLEHLESWVELHPMDATAETHALIYLLRHDTEQLSEEQRTALWQLADADYDEFAANPHRWACMIARKALGMPLQSKDYVAAKEAMGK